jgi:hypothetical protein
MEEDERIRRSFQSLDLDTEEEEFHDTFEEEARWPEDFLAPDQSGYVDQKRLFTDNKILPVHLISLPSF